MATLYLFRHGQASFMQENYDVLSEKGQAQARILGDYLSKENFQFDACFMGLLNRHEGTYQGVAEMYQTAGLHLPPAKTHIGLNEHQGAEIHKHHLPGFLEEPENHALKLALTERGHKDPEVRKGLLRLFFRGTRAWALGELHAEGFESFPAFKERVSEGFEFLKTQLDSHQTVAAFTSGGTIGMILGLVLGLEDEKVMELNWQISNCSITELSYSKGKFYLRGFNANHFFTDKSYITFV